MKTIGLIGGMSWESSVEYYRITNQLVQRKLGGVHSSKSVMVSVDFADVEALQHQGEWDELTVMMRGAAKQVEAAGAEMVLLCTNTMHLMADDVQAAVNIPLVHIADATGKAIKQKGLQKVALLGTKFTMEQDFYKRRLIEKDGIDVIIPDEEGRSVVHDIIYQELVKGIIKESSKAAYLKVIDGLMQQGAEGIILGCTEIPLLIKQTDCDVPLFDTTFLHAQEAVNHSLEG